MIHGAQPDFLVVCDQPGRARMRHGPYHEPPNLERTLDAALEAAALTNPSVRAVGFSLNTSLMEEQPARLLLHDVERQFELPATDPVRYGIGNVVDRLLEDGGA